MDRIYPRSLYIPQAYVEARVCRASIGSHGVAVRVQCQLNRSRLTWERNLSGAPADYLHCLQWWHRVLAGMLVCVNRQRTRQQLALTALFLVVGVM